jgi:hypothetical protein
VPRRHVTTTCLIPNTGNFSFIVAIYIQITQLSSNSASTRHVAVFYRILLYSTSYNILLNSASHILPSSTSHILPSSASYNILLNPASHILPSSASYILPSSASHISALVALAISPTSS